MRFPVLLSLHMTCIVTAVCVKLQDVSDLPIKGHRSLSNVSGRMLMAGLDVNICTDSLVAYISRQVCNDAEISNAKCCTLHLLSKLRTCTLKEMLLCDMSSVKQGIP